jgi:hypothetical protein
MVLATSASAQQVDQNTRQQIEKINAAFEEAGAALVRIRPAMKSAKVVAPVNELTTVLPRLFPPMR